jgi:hypothetical protein
MNTFEFQDRHNPSKVWVIREAGTGYEWNQKIDGNLFYDEFQPVEISWVAQVLGADVAEQAVIALDEQHHQKQTSLEAGDTLEVFVNQGMRDAIVLGVIDDEMIIEYEMPAGTTAMLVLPRDNNSQSCGKSVSYRTCPKKWIKAIFHGTGWWTGRSQTGNEYPFPPMKEKRYV